MHFTVKCSYFISLFTLLQARTLRLLANAYLEWNSDQHWQKALNAVGLANAVRCNIYFYVSRVKVLVALSISTDKIYFHTVVQ